MSGAGSTIGRQGHSRWWVAVNVAALNGFHYSADGVLNDGKTTLTNVTVNGNSFDSLPVGS
jgi:hypothetical protein